MQNNRESQYNSEFCMWSLSTSREGLSIDAVLYRAWVRRDRARGRHAQSHTARTAAASICHKTILMMTRNGVVAMMTRSHWSKYRFGMTEGLAVVALLAWIWAWVLLWRQNRKCRKDILDRQPIKVAEASVAQVLDAAHVHSP